MGLRDNNFYIVYKLDLDTDSDSKRTQTLFLQTLRTKNQGGKNLQKVNNPVKTFIIQNFRSEYFGNLLIQILFGVFRYQNLTLRKKCLYSELFWSTFSFIRTEYGELLWIDILRIDILRIEILRIRTLFTQCVMPLFEKVNIMWGSWIGLPVPVGGIFWGAASSWHDKKNCDKWLN